MTLIISRITRTQAAKMGARELRKMASTAGVTGASRMTKDEILDAMAQARVFSFDRDARDALKPTATHIYDPAGHINHADRRRRYGRAAKNRHDRRHFQTQTKGTANLPRRARLAGLQKPATRLDLIVARVSLGVAK